MNGLSQWRPLDGDRASAWPAAYAAIAGAGLALAIAASGGPEQEAAAGGLARRVIIELPHWLQLVLLSALGVLAFVLLVAMVWLPRKRRKGEQDYEHSYEPPRFALADYVVLCLLATLPLASAGAVLWLSRWLAAPAGSVKSPPAAGEMAAGSPPLPALPPPELLPIHAPTADAVVDTLALFVAVAGVSLMLWFYLVGRWPRARKPPGAMTAAAALNAAVADSVDDLLLVGNARDAIIECYRRFEAVLAKAEVPRRPCQTPTEFMRSALQRYPLPHLAVWELTRLFELARFSRHALEARERDAALSSLTSIKHALDSREISHGPGE